MLLIFLQKKNFNHYQLTQKLVLMIFCAHNIENNSGAINKSGNIYNADMVLIVNIYNTFWDELFMYSYSRVRNVLRTYTLSHTIMQQ
jgi:hypothetical protein